MRWIILFTLLLAVPAYAAESPSASARRGQAIVQRNCGMCHAIGRKDVSANPSAPRFRDLGQRYPVGDLAEALNEGIVTGHPAMPEFRFTPTEVSDIIAYLRGLQTHQAAQAQMPIWR